MTQKDLLKGLGIGFFIGILFIIITKNVGQGITEIFPWFKVSYFYLLPLIFPVLISIWLYVMSLFAKKIPVFWQIARFLTVGAFNASIYLGMLNLLMMIFAIDAKNTLIYAIFIIFANCLAILNSYFWNKTWTFKKDFKMEGKEFIKFFVITGIGVVINMAITVFFAKMIQSPGNLVSGFVAPIIGILIEAIWNFSMYKLLIFKS
jgi:putative flippase GtrA